MTSKNRVRALASMVHTFLHTHDELRDFNMEGLTLQMHLWVYDVHWTFALLKVSDILSFLFNLKHLQHNKQTVCFFSFPIPFRVFY